MPIYSEIDSISAKFEFMNGRANSKILPELEAKALKLAEQCKTEGKCAPDDHLCNEARIKAMFKETCEKLKKEHIVRRSKKRFH